MADTKISDLPAVTTPAATDEFAVNQGGVSKKETRAQVHALESGEHLLLPQVNEPSTPTIAFGDGDTGIYESADDVLYFATAGFAKFRIASNIYAGDGSTAGCIINESATATNPTVCASRSDINTGMGGTPDNVSLIAGGLEGIRVEDPADLGASETSLWLYDDDNGVIQQVTVGIDDSGGAGFKLLRIAN